MKRSERRLILLGTVHLDPHGYDRLTTLLERLKPSVVTVELSPYGYRFRVQEGERIKMRLLELYEEWSKGKGIEKGEDLPKVIRDAMRQIDLPYEWSAPSDYFIRRRRKGRLFPVDVSKYSRQKLKLLEQELVIKENIFSLLDRDEEKSTPEEETNRQACLARGYFRNPSLFHLHYRDDEIKEMEMRDRWMAGKIRSIYRKLIETRKRSLLLHIGGWEHLVESPHYNSLFIRLKDICRERLLL